MIGLATIDKQSCRSAFSCTLPACGSLSLLLSILLQQDVGPSLLIAQACLSFGITSDRTHANFVLLSASALTPRIFGVGEIHTRCLITVHMRFAADTVTQDLT
jgi:hypothetical protein